MATFAAPTFSTSIYAAARPTYPKQLFDLIFAYHAREPLALLNRTGLFDSESSIKTLPAPRWDTALDLGCGTGQATTELTRFRRIIGVDPSKKMVETARQHLSSLQPPLTNKIELVQSAAEELSFVETGCVDLITAAQAAHWFDWSKLWSEAARVIRPGGTMAFWTYSEFRLPSYPSLTPLITAYANGTDPTDSLGSYWQQPGRSIVENHLRDVADPKEGFGELKRIYFAGSHHPSLPASHTFPTILKKKVTWTGFLDYLNSWSSLHTYRKKFGESDEGIEVRFWKKLKEETEKLDGKHSEEIVLEWPLTLCLVRRV